MMGWMHAALRSDDGLAKVVRIGDRVRHYGTRAWGRVLSVTPQPDGTAELVVERERQLTTCGAPHDTKGYWATYHVDQHEPAPAPVTP